MTKTADGIFTAFDQTPTLDEALAEYATLPGGSADVDHRIE